MPACFCISILTLHARLPVTLIVYNSPQQPFSLFLSNPSLLFNSLQTLTISTIPSFLHSFTSTKPPFHHFPPTHSFPSQSNLTQSHKILLIPPHLITPRSPSPLFPLFPIPLPYHPLPGPQFLPPPLPPLLLLPPFPLHPLFFLHPLCILSSFLGAL